MPRCLGACNGAVNSPVYLENPFSLAPAPCSVLFSLLKDFHQRMRLRVKELGGYLYRSFRRRAFELACPFHFVISPDILRSKIDVKVLVVVEQFKLVTFFLLTLGELLQKVLQLRGNSCSVTCSFSCAGSFICDALSGLSVAVVALALFRECYFKGTLTASGRALAATGSHRRGVCDRC